jgi:outer membrane protein assembly factor BamB
MQITEDPVPSISPLWTNDALPGGSASSPDLSADGSRVYVNDNVDSVHALDTATGEEIWRFQIGFASGGSPSLSPDGIDTATGTELDREPLPGTTVFTVGTTVGPDGTACVPTFLGQLFGFHPE